jgi:diguanylate cyclase (GGDEF)-like protein
MDSQHPVQRQAFTEDELLRQPALFRYGPRVLWLVGCVLVALCIIGVRSNGVSARHDAYVAALRFVQAGAASTGTSLNHLAEQISIASVAVRSAVAASTSETLEQNALLSINSLPHDIAAVLVSADGGIVASSEALGSETTDLQTLLARLPAATRAPKSASAVHRTVVLNGQSWFPIPAIFESKGQTYQLLFLVNTRMVESVWRTALAGEKGWLRIADSSGGTLFEIADFPVARDASEAVSNIADALTEKSLWGGKRLIVAATDAGGALTVQSGIQEVVALKEFHRRYKAVLIIVAGVCVLVMSLAAGTAHALKRFEKKEEYLRSLATVDVLTELPNRRHFHTLLERAASAAQRDGTSLALLFADLDNFKYVNDTYGHEAGDLLLRQAARVLSDVVGQSGRVCRLGGDEFTVLVPRAGSPEEVLRLGERLTRALHAPLQVNGHEMHPRASVGAALMPLHAKNESDLMRFADTALYQAKRNGKGCAVVYDETLAAAEHQRSVLSQELEHAISNSEFFLVYQPKFDAASKTLSGFEALVRWQHPRRGVVAPGEFIGLAEESGLIIDLGSWVLRRAVRQMRDWHEQGHGWQRVAVNVSPLQLRDDGFVACVKKVLAQSGVPGEYLQLELTEGYLAAHSERAQALVSELRGLGVKVSVDDFGTGYSSLGALQGYDLDCLKIDRSFVSALDTAKGQEICRAVISFGHALGLRVIAEGVETAEQDDWLARAKCDEVQGFWHSKPLPADRALGASARGRDVLEVPQDILLDGLPALADA